MHNTKRNSQISFDPFDIVEILSGLINPETANLEILRFVRQAFDADCCQVIVKDWEKGGFDTQAMVSTLPHSERDFSTTIINQVINTKHSIFIPNAIEDPHYKSRNSISGKLFLSVIAVPILEGDDPIGVLYLDRRSMSKEEYNREYDLDNLQRLANKLAPIIHLQWDIYRFRINCIKAVMSELDIFDCPSEAMRNLYSKIERFARSDLIVSIQGETGVGKEWIARALHKLSRREKMPFIVADCTQLTKDTAEVELFGSVRGAYTDAIDKKGFFERAEGGTVFLDEIGELPVHVQANLLRVLEKGSAHKISLLRKGGHEEISIDFRVIVATNRNLAEEVTKKRFRQDLLSRLKQLELSIPPLRERKSDILPLAIRFLDKICSQNSGFTERAKEKLENHQWPGNVRELKYCIESAVVEFGCAIPLTETMLFSDQTGSDHVSRTPHNLPRERDLLGYSSTHKYELVLATVKKYGNKSKAARELGISRQSVHNILNGVAYNRVWVTMKRCAEDKKQAANELEISIKILEHIIQRHQGKNDH